MPDILALVTGSTGCVGANLVQALNAHGVRVRGLQRANSPQAAVDDVQMEVAHGDILDPQSLRAALRGVDWVFHVAAVADYWRVPAETVYRVNVEGTRQVMQAALEAGVSRFVLTGSTAALGVPRPGRPLLTEEDTFNLKPADFPYGHSKAQAEAAMAEFVARGLPAVAVLPSAVSGPRDLKFNVGELLRQAFKPGPLPLPPGGLGYIDGRDVAAAHIAAAERGQIGARYILNGENLTHAEAYCLACEAVGRPARVIGLPGWALPPLAEAAGLAQRLGASLPVDRGRVLLSGQRIYYDSSKARRDLGLSTRPFSRSIADAYAWYRDRGLL